MSVRPEEIARELPPEFRFIPRPHTDPFDMEFLLRNIENAQLRNQLIATRLETAAQVLRTLAEGAQKAAGLISGGR